MFKVERYEGGGSGEMGWRVLGVEGVWKRCRWRGGSMLKS